MHLGQSEVKKEIGGLTLVLLMITSAHAETVCDHNGGRALVSANAVPVYEKPSASSDTTIVAKLNLGASVEKLECLPGSHWVKVREKFQSPRTNSVGWLDERELAYPDMFKPVTRWAGQGRIELGAGDYRDVYIITRDGRFFHEWEGEGEKGKDSGKVYSYSSILWFRSVNEKVNRSWDELFWHDGVPGQYIFRDPNGNFCDYTGIFGGVCSF